MNIYQVGGCVGLFLAGVVLSSAVKYGMALIIGAVVYLVTV